MGYPPDSHLPFSCPVCPRQFRDAHGRGGHLATKADAAHAAHRAKHRQRTPSHPAPAQLKAATVTRLPAVPESAPPDAGTRPTATAKGATRPEPSKATTLPTPHQPPVSKTAPGTAQPATGVEPAAVPVAAPHPREGPPDDPEPTHPSALDAFQSSLEHYTLAFGEAPTPAPVPGDDEAEAEAVEAEVVESNPNGGLWALAGVVGTGLTLLNIVKSRKGANVPPQPTPPRPTPASAQRRTVGAPPLPNLAGGAALRRSLRGWPL